MADEEPVTAPTPRRHAGPDPQPGRARRKSPNHSRPGITPANSPDPIPAIMRGPVAPLNLNPPAARNGAEDPEHQTANYPRTPDAPLVDSWQMNEPADQARQTINAARQSSRNSTNSRPTTNAARQEGPSTDGSRPAGPVVNGPRRRTVGADRQRPAGAAAHSGAGTTDRSGPATGVKQAGLAADGRPRARVTVNRRERLAAARKPQVTPPSQPIVQDWDATAALRNDPTTELPIIQDRRRSGPGEVTVDLNAKYGLPGNKTVRRTLTDPGRPEPANSSPDQTTSHPPSWPRKAPAPDEPAVAARRPRKATPNQPKATPNQPEAPRLGEPVAAARRSAGPTGGRVAPKQVRKKQVDRIPAPMQFRPIVCVTDMPANVAFFEQLGAEVVHGQPRSDYVLMQMGTIQLGLVREPASSAQTAVELNFATPYPLADFERRLRAQDVVIAVTVHDTDLGSQLHVESPDGLVIRITQLETEVHWQKQTA